MKLLLTAAGVRNASIHDALVDLLAKPIAESSALCIPTAQNCHPDVGPGQGAWRSISETVWVGLSAGSPRHRRHSLGIATLAAPLHRR